MGIVRLFLDNLILKYSIEQLRLTVYVLSLFFQWNDFT